jgi:hypothetical protein
MLFVADCASRIAMTNNKLNLAAKFCLIAYLLFVIFEEKLRVKVASVNGSSEGWLSDALTKQLLIFNDQPALEQSITPPLILLS